MKRSLGIWGAIAISASLITGCGDNTDQNDVSSAMVDSVVLPSYSRLSNASQDLNQALQNLVNNPTQSTFDKAKISWRSARKTWEVTETWAYGPAETLDFDPNLDDWPVSTNELAATLDSKSNFTAKTLQNLDTTSRGFHGIEYVLFGRNNNLVEDLSSNELAYLKSAGEDLENNADGLLQAWSGSEGFGSTVVKADPRSAIADILAGMEGCLAEVADGKLGGAFDTNDSGELESTFSGNTGTDIVFNIKGVKTAWEKSKLKEYASSKNNELSSTLSNQIDESLKLANKLPAALNDQLTNESTKETVDKLRTVLTSAAETAVSLASEL
jgi:predicted lipoprotein|tara:strand:- start:75 stop:1058 length:984 start_codon:yes stop_codon:yes gene_type:complete